MTRPSTAPDLKRSVPFARFPGSGPNISHAQAREKMADTNSDTLAQFMSITGAEQTAAIGLLEATGWQLQQAVELYFASNGEVPQTAVGGGEASGPIAPAADDNDGEVRAPIPAKVERLVDSLGPADVLPYSARGRGVRMSHHEAFRNYRAEREEMLHGPDAPGGTKGLAKLFKPPLEIMFQGGFDLAKETAAKKKQWLMVNVQSSEEFASHQLNRDTFANDAVKEMISANFVFMQVYDIGETGQKIVNFYKIIALPAILIIDPVTGFLMQGFDGFIEPGRLVEELVKYLDCDPHDEGVGKLAADIMEKKKTAETGGPSGSSKGAVRSEDDEIAMAIAMSMEDAKRRRLPDSDEDDMYDEDDSDLYPSSSEDNRNHDVAGPSMCSEEDNREISEEPDVEPQAGTSPTVEEPIKTAAEIVADARNRLPVEPDSQHPDACSVGIRLPDGKRVARRFKKTDGVQSLYDMCISELEDIAGVNGFVLVPMMPGSSPLEDMSQSLEAAGVANSLLVFRWKD